MTLFLVSALVLAGLVLAPAARLLRRTPHAARGVREAATTLHRAQLRELDRDAALGLVAPAERGGARLEIERRLLAAATAADHDPEATDTGRAVLAVTIAAIPVLAGLLTAIEAATRAGPPTRSPRAWPPWPAPRSAPTRPSPPCAPASPRSTRVPPRPAAATSCSATSRRDSDAGRRPPRPGARRWRPASIPRWPTRPPKPASLAHGGRVGDDDAALLRRALATAPRDAPWRLAAEARLAEREHQSLGR